jgi:hypothetical protein
MRAEEGFHQHQPTEGASTDNNVATPELQPGSPSHAGEPNTQPAAVKPTTSRNVLSGKHAVPVDDDRDQHGLQASMPPAPPNLTATSGQEMVACRVANSTAKSVSHKGTPNTVQASAAADADVQPLGEGCLSDSSDSHEGVPAGPDEYDEMLFDPDEDDDNERVLQSQRHGHTSDALLSCPGCFTTVCVDCQQHASVDTLYRAMFVQNCRLLDSGEEHRVICDVCETDVGSFDAETELFLFECVLASEA